MTTPDGGADAAADSGPPPEAMLTIDPNLQDFGDVPLGADSSEVVFTVTNAGTGPTGSLAAQLVDNTNFTITADDCTGTTLDAGDSCSVGARFSPAEAGAATTRITVGDGDVTVSATLEGNGLENAGLSITPTPHGFGDVTVGETGGPQTFTVTNIGEETSGSIAITLGGTDSTQFELGADECTGTTLAAGETCTVEVVYLPTSAGDHAGSLQATASPGSTVTAALSGTGIVPAALQLVPATQDFGSVVEGSSSADVTFTLTNTGGVATGTLTHSFGGADASEFTVVTTTCMSATLAGGASCNIVVRYDAGSPGDKTATLDVTDGTLTASSNLSATALATGSIAITPSTHDFGTSSVGTATGATTFTITNTGGSPTGALSVAVAGSNPADFPISPGSDGCTGAVLPASGTCTVAVLFDPTVAGTRSATLRVAGTPGGTATAALSGTGEAPASFTLTPTAVDFGSVAQGGTSSPVTFTLTNAGGATSGVPSVALRGAQSTNWTIAANGCTAAVPGGGTCTITLTFTPGASVATGVKTAQVEAAATPGGTVVSDITGTVITPADLGLTPTTANFGDVAETDSADRSVIVTNSGAEASSLTTSITGPDSAQFSILASSTCGATLAGGSSCQLDIRFTPIGQGGRSATLNVVGDPGGSLTAALSGNGIADILLEPANSGDTFDYPDVIIGSFDDTQFRVTNQTTRTLTSLTLAAPPTSGAQFTRTATTCGSSLGPSASCTVTIRFAPTGTAGSRSAPFTVTGSGGATETATLTGTAVGPVRFTQWQVTSAPVETTFPADFGDRAIGGVYEVVLTAQNTGVIASGVIATSSTMTSDLNIVSDTCSGTSLTALGGGGDTCTVTVRFYPRNTGADTGTVTLTYGTNTTSANVTGNGVVGATIAVTGSGNFGTVIATRTATRTFTVTNESATEPTGNISYSLSGSPHYTIVTGAGGGTCAASGTDDLAGDASCTIVVRFSPLNTDSTTTPSTATLVVQQGSEIDNVSLTGLASSQLTLTPATASFTTGEGTTSSETSFTVENVGTTVTGSIVIGVESFPSEFPITNNTCTTLAVGATCTFDVAFAPGSDTDRTDELRVSNGAFVADTARADTAALNGTAASNPELEADPPTTAGSCNANGCSAGGRFWFGRVINGANSELRRFVITNVGELPTGTLSATVSTNPAHFDVVATTCTGTLAGGASCTLDARFSPPTGTGGTIQNGTITVSGTPGGSIDIYVNGTSMANDAPTMNPTPYDFGATPGGTPVGPVTFTVSNNTSGALIVDSLSMYGPSASRFTIAAGTCTVGSSLPAGATCTALVTYDPPAGGPYGFDQATAIVAFPGGFDDAEGAVAGTSLAPAGLSLSPSGSVTYPDTTSGQSSPRTFTVTNTGDVTTSATPAPSIGGADPSQFVIARNTCTTPLAGGASCTFDVEFRPTGAGGRSATLTVTAGSLSAGASLSGTGLAAALLGISPSAPQTCPDHWAGNDTFSCVTYTVSNGGGSSAPLTLAVTDDFTIDAVSTCETSPDLAAGGSCTVIVLHAPSDVGADSGTLTVSSPGVSSVTGTISSNGTAALERTSGTPSFGTRSVTGSGFERTFTITNQANPATGILTYAIAGAHPEDFDVTDDECSGGTLASGAACQIRVRFLPSATGSRTATLTVTDGTGNKTEVISMSGTGS